MTKAWDTGWWSDLPLPEEAESEADEDDRPVITADLRFGQMALVLGLVRQAKLH